MSVQPAPTKHLRRWQRRSRTIAVLRKILPACIALLILGMASQVIWNSIAPTHAVKAMPAMISTLRCH